MYGVIHLASKYQFHPQGFSKTWRCLSVVLTNCSQKKLQALPHFIDLICSPKINNLINRNLSSLFIFYPPRSTNMIQYHVYHVISGNLLTHSRAHCGLDCMVVGLQLPMQSVPITTNIVSSNPAQAKCTQYNIMWSSLSVTCDMSVVFSVTTVSSINKNYHHDITEILLKVALNTITLNPYTFQSFLYSLIKLLYCSIPTELASLLLIGC